MLIFQADDLEKARHRCVCLLPSSLSPSFSFFLSKALSFKYIFVLCRARASIGHNYGGRKGTGRVRWTVAALEVGLWLPSGPVAERASGMKIHMWKRTGSRGCRKMLKDREERKKWYLEAVGTEICIILCGSLESHASCPCAQCQPWSLHITGT